MSTSARPIATVLKPTTIVEDVGNDERTAVIVCHGMGQQIRWQTLCELASSLTRSQVVTPGSGVAVRQVRFQSLAEHVPLGNPRDIGEPFFLGRAETTLHRPGDAAPARDVHIYEAYWAPLTEGRITLRQTIRFLITTGLDGIRHSFRSIARYDGVSGIGDPPIVEKPRPYRNVLWSFGILLILLAVLAMNAAISVAQLQWLLRQDEATTRALLGLLTGDFFTFEVMLLVAFVLFQIALAIRRQARRRSSSWRLPAVASWTLWAVTAGVAVFSVLVGLLIISAHYWAHQSASPYTPGAIEQALLRWPADTVQQWIVGMLTGLMMPAG